MVMQCSKALVEVAGYRFGGCGPGPVMISTVNRSIGISYTNRSVMLAGLARERRACRRDTAVDHHS